MAGGESEDTKFCGAIARRVIAFAIILILSIYGAGKRGKKDTSPKIPLKRLYESVIES